MRRLSKSSSLQARKRRKLASVVRNTKRINFQSQSSSRFIGTIPEWLTLAVLFVATIVAGFEYYDRKAESRIEKSLEFSKRLRAPDMSRAIYELHEKAIDNYPTLSRRLSEEKEQDQNALFSAEMISLVKSNQLEQQAMSIVGLIEDYAVCVQKEICECSTGMSFFEETVSGFWSNYAPYLLHIRTQISQPDFGSSLEKYAKLTLAGQSACLAHN